MFIVSTLMSVTMGLRHVQILIGDATSGHVDLRFIGVVAGASADAPLVVDSTPFEHSVLVTVRPFVTLSGGVGIDVGGLGSSAFVACIMMAVLSVEGGGRDVPGELLQQGQARPSCRAGRS